MKKVFFINRISVRLGLGFVIIIISFVIVLMISKNLMSDLIKSVEMIGTYYQAENTLKSMQGSFAEEKSIQKTTLSVGIWGTAKSSYYVSIENFEKSVENINKLKEKLAPEYNDSLSSIVNLHKKYGDVFFSETSEAGKNIENGFGKDLASDKRRILVLNKVISMDEEIEDSISKLLKQFDMKIYDYNMIILEKSAKIISYIYQTVLIVLVLMGIMFFLVKRITKPIIKVANKLSEIAKNDSVNLDEKLVIKSKDEIEVLANAFNEIQEKQKEQIMIIKYSSDKLAEKNKDITDSITYAQTIQHSILPDINQIKQKTKEHFILWLPRDIVGGDIYWYEEFGENYIIGVVDCTGHSVPGAFMTMIANSVLNRVTGELCNNDPSKILHGVNKLIRKTLNHHTGGSKQLSDDGMDIGLCYVIPKEKKIIYSGARIGLFIVREEGNIEIIKASRQGIGYRKSSEDFEYTNHIINYTEKESFYMTSDGYIDQLGGENNFSLGKEKFIDTLMQNMKEPMDKQKESLIELIENHKGDKHQTDDITVVGFKPI